MTLVRAPCPWPSYKASHMWPWYRIPQFPFGDRKKTESLREGEHILLMPSSKHSIHRTIRNTYRKIQTHFVFLCFLNTAFFTGWRFVPTQCVRDGELFSAIKYLKIKLCAFFRHNYFTLFTFMHWGRKWQPTPVFLPGESQGRRSLVGCCLWGHTESDTTEVT